MSNNPNEVMNFDQLMKKYLKDNDQILNNFDYRTPLKEISPIEPLIFQNDILPDNNNHNNIPNYNPRFNNDINNKIPNHINIRNDLNSQINEDINNKFITPSKPNNKNSSNINSFINSSIEREKALKEEKKKKQLEYQKMLDEQIQEKKLRKQKEKEKRLQEDLLFEEKLKLENEKYEQEQKNKNMNKYRNNTNLFSEDQPIKPQMILSSNNLILEKKNINSNLDNNFNLEKEIEENVQNEIVNNAIKRANSQKYLEIMNNNIFPNNQSPKYPIRPQYFGEEEVENKENPLLQNPNLIKNIPQQQIPIEHLVSTSSQIPGPLLNHLNPNHPQYKTQNSYYPSNRQNQNLSQNILPNMNNINFPQAQSTQPSPQDINPYMTQRQYYDLRKLHRTPSDIGSNTNMSINPSNFPTCYQIPFNNNLMNSSPNPVNFNNNSQNVNELFNMNMNNQNYFGKIMEVFFHEQEKILESYKETIEKLKNERDEAIYKNKANEEKIRALQKLQNEQDMLEKNLGYFPGKNNYQQNMEKTLDSIIQKNDDFNDNNENKLNMNENENENDNKKIEQSINNINNNSNISDSKLVSLITSTKFVKVNSNGDNKKLLETWKKEEEDNIENNNNFQNDNNSKENSKNKYRLSGMDTNTFMEKINSVNNKILEPPDEPQNYLIDNNISIISKTQKNEDKSFANELSNRNDKEDIINFNDNKEEISNIININNKKEIINNNNIISNEKEKINKFNNYNYHENIMKESDINSQKYPNELQNKDLVLNNVHNAVMQNLDNNISISTQIKERLEAKRKELEQNNNKENKNDIISEKEEEFIQNEIINEEKNNNILDNIKINPALKNIDNNLTVSNSKKSYSLLASKKVNSKEKNPYENIVSLNDEEDNINNTNINNNIKDINEEEINDLPNLDSPKNDFKTAQTFGIQKSINNKDINNSKNNIPSKSITKKEEEIIDKLNFFEDDNILSTKIKIDRKDSKNNKILNNINADIDDSFLKDNSNLINNNINKNNINEISKHTNRPPSDLTGDKIASLNNFYDVFKKKKDKVNETNNSILNNNNTNIGNNSLLNESLNTFTQNLNIKWKDLTKKDLNNIKKNREQHYNDDNNYSYLDDDKYEDEKILDKVNQFTKVALNELKQSQLSVFSKDKTVKKYE